MEVLAELALATLFAVHLVAMNVTVGNAVCGTWLEWRGRNCELAWQVNRRLARAGWIHLLVGTAFGFLLGFLIWDEHWSRAIGAAYSRVMFGVVEIIFSFVILLVYSAWLRRTQRMGFGWQLARTVLLFVAWTNLLYHFPALFGVLRNVTTDELAAGVSFSSAEFRSLMFRPEVVSNWIHFALACIAVGGIYGAWVNARFAKEAEDKTRHLKLGRQFARWALVATALQWVVG